jgi:hypothetical protein
MSTEQRQFFENVVKDGKFSRASAIYGAALPRGDAKDDVVDMDYTVHLEYVLSGQSLSAKLPYRARLHWNPAFKTWQIESLTAADK